jgi:starch synthase
MALAAGAGTGVLFAPVTQDALALALERTVRLWRQRATWHRMQLHAMAVDVGWSRPAKHYARVYRDLVAGRPR